MLRLSIVTSICAVLFAISCSGGSTPVPYLMNQDFELQEECITDFSAEEEGYCLVIDENGEISDDCQKNEDSCLEHFYIIKKRGLTHFIHINAKLPCYPEWVIQRYSSMESEWYKNENYRVVSMELASAIVNDNVHLIQYLKMMDLQSADFCYYRLEASIDDLPKGEYTLKLWNSDQELILETIFNH